MFNENVRKNKIKENKKNYIYHEKEIMKKINHKNIVKLKEIIYSQKEIL